MTDNKPWDVIAEIETDNGKLFKEGVLIREAKAGNDVLFAGFQMAFHALNTFGVRQVPFSATSTSMESTVGWDDFVALADALVKRELTGHAARDAIYDFMMACNTTEWDFWYRRILIQDFRAGFSKKTVKNAVKKAKTPHYDIPEFTCALAKDSGNNPKMLSGRKQIEVKLDGVRVLSVIKQNGEVWQSSRNGKELKNFGHIKEELAVLCEEFTEDMVLDGEVMSSSFQDLMTQVNRKTNVNADDAVLHVFDIVPLAEFMAGKGTMPQSARSEWLRELGSAYDFDSVRFLEHEIVDLDDEAGFEYLRKLNHDVLAKGYEGLLIKDPDEVYLCKRHKGWTKLKPFVELTLEVIGYEEGTGKHEGRLGALVCAGVDDAAKANIAGSMEDYDYAQDIYVKVNVGSGFSDEQREEYWANRENILGELVEIRGDAITQNRNGSYSLRFPRFLRFRSIDGEKV